MTRSIIAMMYIYRSFRLSSRSHYGVYLDMEILFQTSELSEYETLAKQIAIYLEKIKLFEQSETDRHLNQDILNTVQEGIQLIDKDRKMIQVNKQLCEIFRSSRQLKKYWDYHGTNGA